MTDDIPKDGPEQPDAAPKDGALETSWRDVTPSPDTGSGATVEHSELSGEDLPTAEFEPNPPPKRQPGETEEAFAARIAAKAARQEKRKRARLARRAVIREEKRQERQAKKRAIREAEEAERAVRKAEQAKKAAEAKRIAAIAAAAKRAAKKAAEASKPKPKPKPKKPADLMPRKLRPLPVLEVASDPTRRRFELGHWISFSTFILLVVLPACVAAWYLWTRASDQYASHVGLTVHRDAAIAPADLAGSLLLPIGGQSPRSDTDILFEYLRSPALVARLAERVDLAKHYTAPYATDPIFALQPGATLSDLIDYWWRILYVRYDTTTGLIDLRVQAFDPDTAQALAQEILGEATRVITELAAQAREDAVRFAEEDVQRAQDQLRAAREALIAFQSKSQILDPETDIAGRLDIITSLQADLAEALIALDALAETAQPSDPRLATAQRRIDVIRLRIEAERSNMAVAAAGQEETYPALLGEFQRLSAERVHATERLTTAFFALDSARSFAAQQNRYVVAYVAPTRADHAVHPKRILWLLAVIGAGFATWFLVNVAYVSVRDRR